MLSAGDTPNEREADIAAAVRVLRCCNQLRALRWDRMMERPRQAHVRERNDWDEV
jgi:hypothetical protein